MPYKEQDFKTSNINYLNKDFSSLKNALINYARTYFPNTYRDFNETSPGMMLIEMAAYVGDVLSFYIDQQYKEMMLPLTEERRNIINLASSLGYKVRATTPSHGLVRISQTVDVDVSDINNIKPDWGQAQIINKGLELGASSDQSLTFQTLDICDFTMSGSGLPEPEVTNTDANGVATEYTLKRDVPAISAKNKVKSVRISNPQKFTEINISDENVIDIVSVKDSNGNNWYEVEYLAQDRIPHDTFYRDGNRTSAMEDSTTWGGSTHTQVAVPFSLEFRKTSKRFVVRTNDDNTTSLIFGNGILKNGQITGTEFLATDQVGITIPGQTQNLLSYIDPFAGDDTSTLGEAPSNTTLTINYRVGGGITSNVEANSINRVIGTPDRLLTGNNQSPTAININPFRGGAGPESIEDIRYRAKGFFATQNRCVNKKDYESRALNLPTKYGKIAKVFVQRLTTNAAVSNVLAGLDLDASGNIDSFDFNNLLGDVNHSITVGSVQPELNEKLTQLMNFYQSWDDFRVQTGIVGQTTAGEDVTTNALSTIRISCLSYDFAKRLVHPTSILLQNLKAYLNEYRLMTDEILLDDGKVVNFGVAFEVVAHKTANKAQVKLDCIDKIAEYFDVDSMQFHQTIYTSDLEYILMDVDGVRQVNFVELTQDFQDLVHTNQYIAGTDLLWDFSQGTSSQAVNSGKYNWKYDFRQFYGPDAIAGDGVILPSVTPSVFELRYPNKNVRGVVI